MSDKSDSEQIDDIIAQQGGWKQEVLVALRAAITAADPAAVEVVKYKKPSKPEGVPFWTHDGDVCFVDVLKNAVRLTFARGARMERSDLQYPPGQQSRSSHRLLRWRPRGRARGQGARGRGRGTQRRNQVTVAAEEAHRLPAVRQAPPPAHLHRSRARPSDRGDS
ncbi:DUF1801 domain-containing protein [Agromyces sp. NPDC055661]